MTESGGFLLILSILLNGWNPVAASQLMKDFFDSMTSGNPRLFQTLEKQYPGIIDAKPCLLLMEENMLTSQGW